MCSAILPQQILSQLKQFKWDLPFPKWSCTKYESFLVSKESSIRETWASITPEQDHRTESSWPHVHTCQFQYFYTYVFFSLSKGPPFGILWAVSHSHCLPFITFLEINALHTRHMNQWLSLLNWNKSGKKKSTFWCPSNHPKTDAASQYNDKCREKWPSNSWRKKNTECKFYQ